MVHGIEGSAADPPAAGFPGRFQGGMGVGVSGWRLARAVAATGHLGVVSGVALDAVLARRLQLGDPDGTVARRRWPSFPAGRRRPTGSCRRYFVAGGLPADAPFRPIPRLGLRPNPARDELTVAGNFVEVYLAKQGHRGPVGVNYLEKIQLATPAAVYGAMLAGVDYVLMGAGIPTEIPGLLVTALARGEPGELTVAVAGAPAAERHTVRFDPRPSGRARTVPAGPAPIPRDRVLRGPRRVPGPRPGDHTGRLRPGDPRRGWTQRAAAGAAAPGPPMGEPVYGPRDDIDLAKVGRHRPAVLGGRRARRQGCADRGQIGRGGRHPGRHRVRPVPGVGHRPGLRRHRGSRLRTMFSPEQRNSSSRICHGPTASRPARTSATTCSRRSGRTSR